MNGSILEVLYSRQPECTRLQDPFANEWRFD